MSLIKVIAQLGSDYRNNVEGWKGMTAEKNQCYVKIKRLTKQDIKYIQNHGLQKWDTMKQCYRKGENCTCRLNLKKNGAAFNSPSFDEESHETVSVSYACSVTASDVRNGICTSLMPGSISDHQFFSDSSKMNLCLPSDSSVSLSLQARDPIFNNLNVSSKLKIQRSKLTNSDVPKMIKNEKDEQLREHYNSSDSYISDDEELPDLYAAFETSAGPLVPNSTRGFLNKQSSAAVVAKSYSLLQRDSSDIVQSSNEYNNLQLMSHSASNFVRNEMFSPHNILRSSTHSEQKTVTSDCDTTGTAMSRSSSTPNDSTLQAVPSIIQTSSRAEIPVSTPVSASTTIQTALTSFKTKFVTDSTNNKTAINSTSSFTMTSVKPPITASGANYLSKATNVKSITSATVSSLSNCTKSTMSPTSHYQMKPATALVNSKISTDSPVFFKKENSINCNLDLLNSPTFGVHSTLPSEERLQLLQNFQRTIGSFPLQKISSATDVNHNRNESTKQYSNFNFQAHDVPMCDRSFSLSDKNTSLLKQRRRSVEIEAIVLNASNLNNSVQKVHYNNGKCEIADKQMQLSNIQCIDDEDKEITVCEYYQKPLKKMCQNNVSSETTSGKDACNECVSEANSVEDRESKKKTSIEPNMISKQTSMNSLPLLENGTPKRKSSIECSETTKKINCNLSQVSNDNLFKSSISLTEIIQTKDNNCSKKIKMIRNSDVFLSDQESNVVILPSSVFESENITSQSQIASENNLESQLCNKSSDTKHKIKAPAKMDIQNRHEKSDHFNEANFSKTKDAKRKKVYMHTSSKQGECNIHRKEPFTASSSKVRDVRKSYTVECHTDTKVAVVTPSTALSSPSEDEFGKHWQSSDDQSHSHANVRKSKSLSDEQLCHVVSLVKNSHESEIIKDNNHASSKLCKKNIGAKFFSKNCNDSGTKSIRNGVTWAEESNVQNICNNRTISKNKTADSKTEAFKKSRAVTHSTMTRTNIDILGKRKDWQSSSELLEPQNKHMKMFSESAKMPETTADAVSKCSNSQRTQIDIKVRKTLKNMHIKGSVIKQTNDNSVAKRKMKNVSSEKHDRNDCANGSVCCSDKNQCTVPIELHTEKKPSDQISSKRDKMKLCKVDKSETSLTSSPSIDTALSGFSLKSTTYTELNDAVERATENDAVLHTVLPSSNDDEFQKQCHNERVPSLDVIELESNNLNFMSLSNIKVNLSQYYAERDKLDKHRHQVVAAIVQQSKNISNLEKAAQTMIINRSFTGFSNSDPALKTPTFIAEKLSDRDSSASLLGTSTNQQSVAQKDRERDSQNGMTNTEEAAATDATLQKVLQKQDTVVPKPEGAIKIASDAASMTASRCSVISSKPQWMTKNENVIKGASQETIKFAEDLNSPVTKYFEQKAKVTHAMESTETIASLSNKSFHEEIGTSEIGFNKYTDASDAEKMLEPCTDDKQQVISRNDNESAEKPLPSSECELDYDSDATDVFDETNEEMFTDCEDRINAKNFTSVEMDLPLQLMEKEKNKSKDESRLLKHNLIDKWLEQKDSEKPQDTNEKSNNAASLLHEYEEFIADDVNSSFIFKSSPAFLHGKFYKTGITNAFNSDFGSTSSSVVIVGSKFDATSTLELNQFSVIQHVDNAKSIGAGRMPAAGVTLPRSVCNTPGSGSSQFNKQLTNGSHKCCKCGECFKSKFLLKAHKKSHIARNKFVCLHFNKEKENEFEDCFVSSNAVISKCDVGTTATSCNVASLLISSGSSLSADHSDKSKSQVDLVLKAASDKATIATNCKNNSSNATATVSDSIFSSQNNEKCINFSVLVHQLPNLQQQKQTSQMSLHFFNHPQKMQNSGQQQNLLQPTQTEQLQPTQTEQLQPTQTEQLQPTQTEQLQPTQTEQLQPTQTEQLQPTQTEQLQPTQTEQLQPTQTEQLQPTQTEQLQPTQSEQLQPTQTEQQQPTQTDQLQPTQTEQLQPTQTQQLQPTHTEQLQPTQTEQLHPTLMEQLQPTLTEQLQPTLTEQLQPTQMEQLQPTQTEQLLPTETEQLQPTQTEQLQPTQTEQLQPTQMEQQQPSQSEHLQPTQTDQLLPTQTEQLQPTQTEQLLPTQQEQLQPMQTEQLLPTKTEQLLPTQQEQLQPTQTEQLLPTKTEQLQPTQMEQLQPTQSEQLQPTQTEQQQPTQTAQLQPTQTDQLQPTQTEQLQPTQTQQLQPTQAEQLLPTQTEQLQPTQAEQLLPTQTEQLQPTQAEQLLPTQTQQLQPTQAEQLLPTQTEQLYHKDSHQQHNQKLQPTTSQLEKAIKDGPPISCLFNQHIRKQSHPQQVQNIVPEPVYKPKFTIAQKRMPSLTPNPIRDKILLKKQREEESALKRLFMKTTLKRQDMKLFVQEEAPKLKDSEVQAISQMPIDPQLRETVIKNISSTNISHSLLNVQQARQLVNKGLTSGVQIQPPGSEKSQFGLDVKQPVLQDQSCVSPILPPVSEVQQLGFQNHSCASPISPCWHEVQLAGPRNQSSVSPMVLRRPEVQQPESKNQPCQSPILPHEPEVQQPGSQNKFCVPPLLLRGPEVQPESQNLPVVPRVQSLPTSTQIQPSSQPQSQIKVFPCHIQPPLQSRIQSSCLAQFQLHSQSQNQQSSQSQNQQSSQSQNQQSSQFQNQQSSQFQNQQSSQSQNQQSSQSQNQQSSQFQNQQPFQSQNKQTFQSQNKQTFQSQNQQPSQSQIRQAFQYQVFQPSQSQNWQPQQHRIQQLPQSHVQLPPGPQAVPLLPPVQQHAVQSQSTWVPQAQPSGSCQNLSSRTSFNSLGTKNYSQRFSNIPFGTHVNNLQSHPRPSLSCLYPSVQSSDSNGLPTLSQSYKFGSDIQTLVVQAPSSAKITKKQPKSMVTAQFNQNCNEFQQNSAQFTQTTSLQNQLTQIPEISSAPQPQPEAGPLNLDGYRQPQGLHVEHPQQNTYLQSSRSDQHPYGLTQPSLSKQIPQPQNPKQPHMSLPNFPPQQHHIQPFPLFSANSDLGTQHTNQRRHPHLLQPQTHKSLPANQSKHQLQRSRPVLEIHGGSSYLSSDISSTATNSAQHSFGQQQHQQMQLQNAPLSRPSPATLPGQHVQKSTPLLPPQQTEPLWHRKHPPLPIEALDIEGKVCHACSKTPLEPPYLYCCSGVYYCNTACQDADWDDHEEHHKPYTPVLN